jgi:hypothetical protein
MAFPGPKVHRLNRRKLGRGQYPSALGTQVTAAPSTNSVILTFARPVLYGGAAGGGLALTVGGRSVISATQNTPTQITVLMNGTVATLAWNFPGGQTNIRTQQGGTVDGASGTFP